MKLRALLLVVILWGFSPRSLSAGTDIFRYESVFRRNSPAWINHNWWIHDEKRFEVQVYTFYDLEQRRWNEFNVTSGPIIPFKYGKLVFPMGVRFHPRDKWHFSHFIAKINGFGRIGEFPFSFINDLSWGRAGRKSEHFLQYQFFWQPTARRVGLGVQSDAFLLGSKRLSWTIGPAMKVSYLRHRSENDAWDWTVTAFPFYDLERENVGTRLNFLTFRFGK